MKGIKKFIPVLLATVFTISSLTAISAFAQQDKTFKQDGLNATLTTDKSEYEVNEKINVTLKVENTNPYTVNNIQTELFRPEGFKSETEELKQDGFALEQEKSKVQNAVFAYIPVSKPVETGDAVTAVSAAVAVASFVALAFIAVKQKHIRQAGTIALVICLALAGTLQISAKAENGERSFTIENTVVYGGKNVTVKATVSYLFEQYRNLTVDGEKSIRKVGETVSLTAKEAESGMHFANWQALKGKVTFVEESGLTSFVMPDEDVELKAVYEINKYKVNVTCEGKGTVSPANGTLVEHGGNKKFTFTPDTGYHIKSVLVDGTDIGEKNGDDTVYPESYEFKNVREEHSLKVTFDVNLYRVDVYYYQKGEDNYFTNASIINQPYGSSGIAGFPAKSLKDGGDLEKVVVDGTDMGAITRWEWTNISESHVIKVYYEKSVA